MSGGGETQTTEQTQRSAPWDPFVQPITGNLLPLISGQLNNPMQFFPGQTYANQTQAQQDALAGQAGYAGGVMPGMVGSTQDAWRSTLDPMGVINNPVAWGGLQGRLGDISRTLTEQVFPGIEGGAIGAGGRGGSREALAKGVALGRGIETGQEAAAGLASDLYRQGLAQQQFGLNYAPQAIQLGMMPYETQYQLGGIERQEQQRAIDEQMARHQFGQMEPWQRAQMGANLLYPGASLGGYATGSSTTEKETEMSPFGLAMGLGMAGLGMLSGNPMSGMGGLSGLGGLFGGGGGGGGTLIPSALNMSSMYRGGPTSMAGLGMDWLKG